MRSIISRQGGKARLYKYLIPMFPKHTHYAEVFGGAGWCLINKPEVCIEIFNDIDTNLINLFRVLRDFPGEFVNRYRYELVSRKSFDEYKKIEFNKLPPIDRAVAWYYVYYNSFVGDMSTFILRKYQTNPNRFISRLPKLVENFANRFTNVIIEDIDFRDFFKKYNTKDFFFYLDPPYYGTAGYEVPFVEQDHIDLSNCLQTFKGRFLLTYNDHPTIRALYKGFTIKNITQAYQAANRPSSYIGKSNTGRQIIIKNY